MPKNSGDYQRPLVSVYIVNHNYARYVSRAVDSVLRQTLENIELIIIDDGSTDNSREVIEQCADNNENITTIFQHNKGLNVTNNIALRAARGRYIMRLDADDWLEEHAVQILSSVLDRMPEVGMVFPDYYLVDTDGNVTDIVRRHDFSEVTLMDQPAHGACTMVRADCLHEVGGYDEDFRRQDGYELWVRFIQHYGVQNVNLPLFYYRQHSMSLTRNKEQLLETRARILEKNACRMERRHQKALAIIPVRGQVTEPDSRALRELGGKALINWTLDVALASQRIDDVVVTSPDETLLSYVKAQYGEQVMGVKRNPGMARRNSYLEETLFHALERYQEMTGTEPDILSVLYIESPFRLVRHIDSAIDMLELFNTDSVVSVRPETDVFYQHNGRGLQAIRPGNKLRLEADELYREVGDMHTVRTEFFKQERQSVGGQVGHIVMDEKCSFSILSDFDWEIAELYVVQHGLGVVPNV